MAVLVMIIFFCPFCQGGWDAFSHWDVFGGSAEVGNNFIQLWCYCYMKTDLVNHREIAPVMFAQIRQNKSSTWRDIGRVNKTGFYKLSTDQIVGNYTISDGACENSTSYYYYCRMHIIAKFEISGCSVDPNLYSVFRCQFSNGSGIITSHEKDLLKDDDITFRRGNIKIQTNSQNSFRVGDVVELEFNGDVEGIISLTESVKWCKRTEGEFRPISLQDAPMITLVPIGGIYCSQISRIFYHIAQNDTDLEIMCDLDFWLKNKNRCAGGYNSPKLMINTSIEDNEWRISQIIIYDKFGVINPNNFSIEGTGRTIHLLCVASALSTTKAPVMNWCVRKKDHVTWSKIVLQEEEIKAFGNNSVEALKFSRITYHITQYDKVVQFLCEISASSLNSCGSGLNLVNVTISKNEDKIQERIDITETQEPIITSTTVLPLESTEHQGRTYITETQDPKITSTTVLPLESTEHQGISTVSVLAALSVLLFVLLTVIVLLVITACRRGKFTFLGFIIKIKREKKDTGDEKGNENKTDISLQKERRKNKDSSKINIGFERQSIYENEDLKNENDASTVKTDNESSKYEELKIRDNQQEYEELNL